MHFSMPIRRLLGNQRGMGLPAVMMYAVAGLLVIASAGTLLNQSFKSTVGRGDLGKYESFIENFKNVLEDPGACTSMLENKRINTEVGAVTTLTLDHDFDDGTADLHPNWKDPTGTFRIQNIIAETIGPAVRQVRHPTQKDPYDTYPVRIVIPPTNLNYTILKADPSATYHSKETKERDEKIVKYHKRGFEAVNPLVKSYMDTRIFVNIDNLGFVRNCHGYDTDASVCVAAGGTYDFDESNARFKCKPDRRCFSDQQGIVTSQSACKAPYNTNISSLGVINGQDSFLCGWCHPYAGDENEHDVTDVTDAPIADGENWLEKELLDTALKLKTFMEAGVAPTDPKVLELAAYWDYLIETAIESDSELLGLESKYHESTAVVAARDKLTKQLDEATRNLASATTDLSAINRQITSFEAEFVQVTADAIAARALASQATLAAAASPGDKSLRDAALAAEAAANAAEGLTQAKQAEIVGLRQQLIAADTTLNGLQTHQNQLTADLSALSSSANQAEQVVDPINAIREILINDYGIDVHVIDYADAARGR